MKSFLRKSVIATTLVLSIAASSFSAQAQNNTLVYDKDLNPSIGITVANAAGAAFTIRDKKGNVILQGTVKNDKTFFIPTGKLGKGTYQFFIGGLAIQEFIIK